MDDLCYGSGRVTTVHRFFVPSSLFEKGLVYIRGEEAYHLSRILRARPGQIINVFNEKAEEFKCKVISVKGREVVAEIIEEVRTSVEPPIRINIVQGLIKAAKMDIVIQKCTEIGAASFQPVITEYSSAKPNQPEKQLQRWDRIALEAAKQSERRVIPQVLEIISLEQFLSAGRNGNLFYMDARAGIPLKQVFAGVKLPSACEEKEFTIAVGPEGGFSIYENDMLEKAGYIPLHLGPRILRTETAAAVLAALILYEFGDMG